MVYRGTVKGKVIVLEPGVELEEGTVVDIQLAEQGTNGLPPGQHDPFRIGELAVETGISDLAANADHYLYGQPKATHGG